MLGRRLKRPRGAIRFASALVALTALLSIAGLGMRPAQAEALTRLPAVESSGPEPQAVSNLFALDEPSQMPPSAEVMKEESSTPVYDLPIPPLQPDLEEIRKRLEALEKATAEKPESKSTESKSKEQKAGDDKLKEEWVDLSSEKWNIKLGGHMQLDSINWADVENPPVPEFNYIEFRRLRLLADGVGYGVLDFRIQIDIEPEAEDTVTTPVTVIKDAYLTMNELPLVRRWRIGNFFVPFSLEQVTNDTNNIFMERSIPTQNIFAADREVGMALYGVNDAKDFTWTTGVFVDSLSEALKERIDDNQGQRVSGRLTYLPYYDEPSNGRYLIHTGAGVLYTHDQDGLARFRARPQIHEGPFLIDSGLFPANSYTTGNIELATVWGQFSVQSEAFLCTVDRTAADAATIGGAYVYASYFLTGENRIYERYGQHGAQFGRNVPYSNFFWVPGGCGPGACELKARWSNLTLNEIDSGQYNDFTFGFNWYWNDRVRVMFDWIHPVTAPETKPYGGTTSDIVAMRFDYNF